MRRSQRWHDGTWICSLRGHVAPAAVAGRLRPEDDALGVDLEDGTRVVRCLRCDLWLRVDAPVDNHVRWPELPDRTQLELPLRDAALHDRLVLRLIAVERMLHVLLFGFAALAAVVVDAKLPAIEGWAHDVLVELQSGIDASASSGGHSRLVEELSRLSTLQGHTLRTLALASAAYAVMEAVEAVGLWRGRRWAEYLTVVATAALLPLEIREVIDRPTGLKLLTMSVNLAILVWLVWAKRLFGLRGGAAALAHTTDWDAVLGDPRTSAAEARLAVGPPALAEPRSGAPTT